MVVEVTMTIFRFLKNKNLSFMDSAENTMLSMGEGESVEGLTILGELGGQVLLVFQVQVVSVVEGDGARFHVGSNVQIIIIALELKLMYNNLISIKYASSRYASHANGWSQCFSVRLHT